MNEDAIIRALHARLGGDRRGPASIGDDGVELDPADGRIVVLDTLVDGVHFRRDWSSPADAAFKAIATNASDLWAMGAEPTAWLLSLGLPPEDAAEAVIRSLVDGFAAAFSDLSLDAALVGGDTVRSPALTLSVTMFGRADAAPLLRSGARVGDRLYVDGPLGSAAGGLAAVTAGRADAWPELVDAHRRPRPRRLLAAAARSAGITAAIDVSDGLVRDAERLLRASGVGAFLLPELPGRDALETAATALEADPLDWQLHGGDDYVRLVAASRPPGPNWTCVGEVVADPGLTLRGADDSGGGLVARGFEHFGDAPPGAEASLETSATGEPA